MDEGVCSMPCSGDATQFCGGLDSLSCYSPDGEPYGWASAGPQPHEPTIQPPEVVGLDIGGVAETQITTPGVIFPPPSADPDDIMFIYGKTTSQPLGDLPRNFTFSAPPDLPSSSSTPFGGGGVAPGRGTLSRTTNSNPPPNSSVGSNANPSSTPSMPSVSNTPSSPVTPGSPGGSTTQSISSNPNTPGTPGSLNTPGTPGVPNASSTPSAPSTPGTLSTLSTPGISSTSTGSSSNGSVAPSQSVPPAPSVSEGSSSTTSTGITPASPSTNSIPNGPGGSVPTNPPSSPNESTLGASESSNSTPNGGNRVAPGHGQASSTISESENPSSVPSSEHTTPANITPPGDTSTIITPTEPEIPNQETLSSASVPGGSMSCVSGIGMSCSPTISSSDVSPSLSTTSPGRDQGTTATPGNPSTTPAQTEGPTLPPGGGNPPTSTLLSSSEASTTGPSSSPPFGGGGVAPGHGQPSRSTLPLPSSSIIFCTPGSTDVTCISSSSGGSTSPSQRGSSSGTPNTSPTTCPEGLNDPACTSPVGGGGVAPGRGQPSTPTPGGIPSTCLAGSTDPACTLPIDGSGVTPSHSQPSLTSSIHPNNPSTPASPASQTNLPGTSSRGSTCLPGLTGPDCTAPGNEGSLSSTGTSNQATITMASSMPFTSTILSTMYSISGSSEPIEPGSEAPTSAHGSSSLVTTVRDSSTLPESNEGTSSNTSPNTSPLPGQPSISTPEGAGGVAPGHQNPSTQPFQGSSQISETARSPPGELSSSIAPTETNPNPSFPNTGLTSPSIPSQPTTANPNQGGGEGPSPESSGPQTSYTYPPGIVPYGSHPSSMTTLASMLVWREPNGEVGEPTMSHPAILHNGPNPQQEIPVLDFEEAPTVTTTFTQPANPRWQRIRPVYVW
ncbi:putative 40S ribosomal protein s2 protein [Rosellinia necatrix]|uniref:Putative 40S ribosomal protein s2 protein n=1 Tax=Rosellinia necatrix TaxID=77044 RepID=A0A1S8A7C6_ROSNE|nr:putative 40S ribosomal protein s2 protein [Rosellinia necatrix]